MSYRLIARAQLKIDEGVRAKPYRDSVGKLTIGVGRNLDDVGVRPEEIDFMLDNDLEVAEDDVRALFPTFEALSDSRKAVLLNMSFNLGRERLAAFHRFREAIKAEEWERASAEMLDSRWAEQ